jgi:murein L,D-transpeptidase YafK
MKKQLMILLVIILQLNSNAQDFKSAQKNYPRVKTAYQEKEQLIISELKKHDLTLNQINIYIRVFKKEALVEVWVKNRTGETYIHFKDYKICSSSGGPGPKRKDGDGQVPEGFYYISRFNPASRFYLSLGINYPNASDKIIGNKNNFGGDIFIHGNCVTIGCIPITDDKIKELYLLAVEAKNNMQDQIPVHIFPCKLDNTNYANLKNEFSDNNALINFWTNLKTGFEYFENTKTLPNVSQNNKGKYLFK